jgi:hypothetical protein
MQKYKKKERTDACFSTKTQDFVNFETLFAYFATQLQILPLICIFYLLFVNSAHGNLNVEKTRFIYCE